MTTTAFRSICSTGEYFDSLKGCQVCSVVQSWYQELLCPCEPFRDAVTGCKTEAEALSALGSRNNLCRPRNGALQECARRGYMSSVASRTTASDRSMALLTVTSVSASASTLAGESTQLHSTTAASIYDPSPSLSFSTKELLSVAITATLLLLCAAVIVVVLRMLLLRKTHRRQAEKPEEMQIRTRLIDKDPVALRGDVNGISTPQVIVINGTTPSVDKKPSSVVHNYHVVVKDSQFTQVGSQNVMNVAEQIASVIGSAGDSNNDEEERMSSDSGSDPSDDENDPVVDYAWNSCVLNDAGFGHMPGEQPECTHPPTMVRGGIVDHLEEGNAYHPINLKNSNTIETQTENLTSFGYSSGRSDETEATSSQSGSLRTVSLTAPHRSSATCVSDRSEGPSGCRRCGDENTLHDICSSSLPTEITDSFSHQMSDAAKEPASQPVGVSSSNIIHGPAPSPAGDQCGTPTVSGSLQTAGGMALPPSLTSQMLASLSKGGQCSVDSGDSNSSLLVHPPARQSASAGQADLLTSPVQNSDRDPRLPLQTVSLHSLPLGVSGGPREVVAAV